MLLAKAGSMFEAWMIMVVMHELSMKGINEKPIRDSVMPWSALKGSPYSYTCMQALKRADNEHMKSR